MTVFADPVDGVPFTDADGLDDRTAWLRTHNPSAAELTALMGDPVGLWRASTVADGWVPADGWGNEGTGGASLDLHAATDGGGSLVDVDGVGTDVIAGDLVEPALVAGGFEIGFNSGGVDDGLNDFGFYGAFALDMATGFTVTLDFTPAAVGVSSMRYLRKGGPFGYTGVIIEEAVMFGGFIGVAIDGPNFAYSPPTIEGFMAMAPQVMVAGRQQVTLAFDGADAFAYRDGVAIASIAYPEFADPSTPSSLPLFVGPGQTVHNIAFHDAALTAAQVAAMHSVFAAL